MLVRQNQIPYYFSLANKGVSFDKLFLVVTFGIF